MSCNSKCDTRPSPFQKRKYFGKNNRKTKEKKKNRATMNIVNLLL